MVHVALNKIKQCMSALTTCTCTCIKVNKLLVYITLYTWFVYFIIINSLLISFFLFTLEILHIVGIF